VNLLSTQRLHGSMSRGTRRPGYLQAPAKAPLRPACVG
jgi:hypothetical protein